MPSEAAAAAPFLVINPLNAGRVPATVPGSAYDYPHHNFLEMSNVRQGAESTASRASRISEIGSSEAGYSSLGRHTVYAETYAGLAGGHKTYAQTSETMLPGQLMAAAAAAAAYEEPTPARRRSQQTSSSA
jgi:hypothetical protein